MILILHDNCPARYVNDAKGRVNVPQNVKFVQHPNPQSLYHDTDKGLQLFLQLQATADIQAGQELCCAYGHNFWTDDQNVKHLEETEEKFVELALEEDSDEPEMEMLEVQVQQTPKKQPKTRSTRPSKATLSEDEDILARSQLVFDVSADDDVEFSRLKRER
jgi:hypothetical protein